MVEGADDLLSRKEIEKPDTGENLDNVVFSWNFGEDGTDGWKFEGFSPWIENGNLCAWSQSGYQAVFSYTVEDVPNGKYALMEDIKVKSNMRNVQVEISSGDNKVKSDSIDTADFLLDDDLLEGRLEIKNNTVTITYYLDSPTDSNGTTFMVGDIKLICVEEAEESTEPSEPTTPSVPTTPSAPDVVVPSGTTTITDTETPLAGQTAQDEAIPAAGETIEDTEKEAKEEIDVEPEDDTEDEPSESNEQETNTENGSVVAIVLGLLIVVISVGAGIILWRRKKYLV